MMDVLLGLAPVVVPILFLLLIPGRFQRRSETHMAWSQLAASTDLFYYPRYDIFCRPFPGSLSGKYRERKVSLAYKKEEVSEYAETFVRVWIAISSSEYGNLTLTEKRSPSKIGSDLFIENVDGINDEFDRRFIVRSEPASFAFHVFSSPELRRKLIKGPTPSFIVSRAKVGLESKILRWERGFEYWQSALNNLCDVAEAIEETLVYGYFGDPDELAAA